MYVAVRAAPAVQPTVGHVHDRSSAQGEALCDVQQAVYDYAGAVDGEEEGSAQGSDAFNSGVLVLGVAGEPPVGPMMPGVRHEEITTNLASNRVLRAGDVLLVIANDIMHVRPHCTCPPPPYSRPAVLGRVVPWPRLTSCLCRVCPHPPVSTGKRSSAL